MSVTGLDHVNIRTPDVAGTIGFFRDVLQMRVGPQPGMADMSHGGWVLDADGAPVVHIGSAATPYPGDDKHPFTATRGGGAVHHIAFNCANHQAMLDRFRGLGLEYTQNSVPAARLEQIFLHDPNHILIELNFRDS